jgi:hypothetical protein
MSQWVAEELSGVERGLEFVKFSGVLNGARVNEGERQILSGNSNDPTFKSRMG